MVDGKKRLRRMTVRERNFFTMAAFLFRRACLRPLNNWTQLLWLSKINDYYIYFSQFGDWRNILMEMQPGWKANSRHAILTKCQITTAANSYCFPGSGIAVVSETMYLHGGRSIQSFLSFEKHRHSAMPCVLAAFLDVEACQTTGDS